MSSIYLSGRSTGRTSAALRSAPKGAIFVWADSRTQYAEQLAKHLGRGDLKVVSLEKIASDRMRGIRPPAVVFDHTVCDSRVLFDFNDEKTSNLLLLLYRTETPA